MSKTYDATLKDLLDQFGTDWVSWLAPAVGLPAGATADPLDADVSTVTADADKVFRLRPPAAGLLHLEFQSTWDDSLPDRMLKYNVLLHDRYGGPVYSIAVLLRREAVASVLTGTLERTDSAGRVYHQFRYTVLRLWEQPLASFLNGPPGLLPLAAITDEAVVGVPAVLQEMVDRLRAEGLPPARRESLLASAYFLLGLRYDNDVVSDWFRRMQGMEDSSTYQHVLRKGNIRTGQDCVLEALRARFGAVPHDLELRVRSMTDVQRLVEDVGKAYRVASLDEFEL